MTDVWWHSCGMGEVPPEGGWLAPQEKLRFSGMRYTKRRTEALLGRWTAKCTVAVAAGRPTGIEDLAAVVVRNAADGAPEVLIDGAETGLTLAMTDRADWAVAAVRRGPERIGCDLELVEARSDGFVADYLTPAEQSLVAARGDRALWANLVWSAKESALKVLRTGLRRDTRSVEVTPEPGTGDRWTPLHLSVDGQSTLHGWWIRYGDFVLTVAAAVPVDPPHPLIAPPPLASAIPTHSWMNDPLPPG